MDLEKWIEYSEKIPSVRGGHLIFVNNSSYKRRGTLHLLLKSGTDLRPISRHKNSPSYT